MNTTGTGTATGHADEPMDIGRVAAAAPDRLALVLTGSGETLTFGELDDLSRRIARVLHDAGLRPGDSIALLQGNDRWFTPICWAAQRSGLRYTAVSTRLTPGEIEYIVRDSGASALFASHALHATAVPARAAVPELGLALMSDGTGPGFDPLEDAVAAVADAGPLPDEREGADMLYSSGTTGKPKGVRLAMGLPPFGTASPSIRRRIRTYGFGPATRYLSPAPMYHAAPMRFSLAVQRAGGTVYCMEHFDPEETLRIIDRERITHGQFVPTMFVRLLRLPPEVRSRYDCSSLEVAVHAAAPCPVPVKEQMIEWWGPILHEYYAGTEGNGLTELDAHEWLRKRGSVGRAVLGELHICDDDGVELAPGQPGTVYFGNGPAFEYHNDPAKTAGSRHPTQPGWSTLGDIGYVDDEGYLFLTDRQANMIISGGVNIYPQEAENLLLTHPKVADVAVFGVPDADFGEAVKAVVQPVDMADAGPALERELLEFCRSQLAHLKCPRSVDFEAELPRHATGKLYKRLLRDRYWQGHASKLV